MGNITATAFPALADCLSKFESIGVMVSGGCDSEVLLRAAADVLGNGNVIAFNAVTPFIAHHYLELAKRTAIELGVKLIQVEVDLLSTEEIKQNTPERCYFCEKRLSVLRSEKNRIKWASPALPTALILMTPRSTARV